VVPGDACARARCCSGPAQQALPQLAHPPWQQVLSLPKNADSAAVLRAYRNKLREAKGNDAATERIEAAHTSLLMRGLNSRLTVCLAAAALPSIVWCMARFADGVPKAVLSLHLRQLSHQRLLPLVAQGGATVAADVKYADRAVYFPWRPRCSARCSHRALGVSAWHPGGLLDAVTACNSSTGLLGLAGRPKWLPGQELRQRAQLHTGWPQLGINVHLVRVRRRLYKADRDIMLWGGVAQALLCAWAVLLSVTAGSQPIITSACVGAGANILKQFRIFPPAGGGPDGPGDEKRQGAPRTRSLCGRGRGSRPACPPALAGSGAKRAVQQQSRPCVWCCACLQSSLLLRHGGTAVGRHSPNAPVTVLVAGAGRY